MKLTALCTVVLAILMTACVSEPSGPILSKSRGVVLSYSPMQVWEQTKVTFSSIGRVTRVDEEAMMADVAVGQDTVVLATIEPYDKTHTRTIVRISARKGKTETPDVASQVLSKIQEQLLRSQMR
ncbi:MAG: hypothetical protein ACI8QZ_001313 [Chlamydiales bacterium]|jgi:hypothetical protein